MKYRTWLTPLTFLMAAALTGPLAVSMSGCSDAGGGEECPPNSNFCIQKRPEIEVRRDGLSLSNGQKLEFDIGTVGQETFVARLELANIGDKTLEVKELGVTSEHAGAFRLVPASGELPAPGAPVTIAPKTDLGEVTVWAFDLLYTRPAGAATVTGNLHVRSNSQTASSDEPQNADLVFPLGTASSKATILVSPGVADFGNVGGGGEKNIDVKIFNTGNDVLVVDGFRLAGPSSYSVVEGQGTWTADESTAAGVTLSKPWEIAPGESHTVRVKFQPSGPEGAEGELRFISNDPTGAALVKLKGNVGGPCIAITPKTVNFGGKLVGKQAEIDVEILSCGDVPLVIEGIRLLDDSSTDYVLDLTKLSSSTTGLNELGPTDPSVSIPFNKSAHFTVRFTPDQVNGKDGDGKVIPDLGKIEILSDTFVGTTEIEIQGYGVEVECPTPVVKVQEGEEVIPQTKLHLIGSQSFASSGPIAKYQWTVTQPNGSASLLLPSASAPDPTFEANVAGTYTFCLEVWDQSGVQSCEPTCYTVIVNPDQAIHIELLWDTPGDPDQTDEGPEAGADLDIHFLHPFATGYDVDGDGVKDGWFDNPFDAYWFNPSPEWGSFDPLIDDNPSLDRDDTDGAGPENINLNEPEVGMTYRIGVHYWNDHGFGLSKVTVRIYIFGSLKHDISDLEMMNNDICEVATVDWPSTVITPVVGKNGGYKCSNFQHPLMSF